MLAISRGPDLFADGVARREDYAASKYNNTGCAWCKATDNTLQKLVEQGRAVPSLGGPLVSFKAHFS
jgi:hypothetical protein